MNYGELLTDSRWNIIKELSKKEQTPTYLATKTNTSLANISQQLRLLEAYGLVKKEKQANNKEPGKPKNLYSIGKEVVNLTFISKHMAEKRDLELYFMQKVIIRLWLNLKKEEVYFLEKFLILHEEVIKKCQAISIVKTSSEQIELLIITKDVHELRAKYSNKETTNLEGKTKKIVCWTHTIEEIEQGIANNEEYFNQLISNIKPIIDKENFIDKIMKIKNGKSQ